MEQIFGVDFNGNLKKAVSNIHSPAALILMTTEANFETHVQELEELFPNIPSIGGIGMSYAGVNTNEKGVTVVALTGVSVVADVLEHASTMPVKYISRLEHAIHEIQPSSINSACFDFCSGSDSKIITTLNLLLNPKHIPLIGGTVDCNKVSVNGFIYEDACGFLMLKNNNGKITTYKENIYLPRGDRFIATKTNPEQKLLFEVDDTPAEEFYRKTLGITKAEVGTQTLKNPLGRVFGDETYLISIKQVNGNALECYKQVTDFDVLTIMELGDYNSIIEDTINQIKHDLPKVKGVLSVNCIFRYSLFTQDNYMKTYLQKMNALGVHAGLFGYGEHYNKQHINQTMCCIAFD